jgi:Spy/CpxP family protein refolding chaperone
MKVHLAKLWLVGMVMVACVLWGGAPAMAQDAKGEAKAEQAKKAPAKPRGRLPPYFNQVVTPAQRDQIYAAQKPLMEKIEALEAQIAELRAQLEKESRAVLTPEQLKKVDELAAATQEKIKAARAAGAAKSPAPAEAASATPAKPAAAPAKK